MPRDEFSPSVKTNLAKRVGFLCSHCGRATTGPTVDPKKSINVGVASHITAAASGGPRYDASLTPELRSSIENGIWLCHTCAKLVDSDAARYTVTLLCEWKKQAEEKALSALEGATATLTFSYTEDGPELRGNGTVITPLEWTALFNRYLKHFDESAGAGDETGKANVVATIKAFEETFDTTVYEEDLRLLESEIGKKADLFFRHITGLWGEVTSRTAPPSDSPENRSKPDGPTAERRKEVAGRLKFSLGELMEAFYEAQSGKRFESSEQRLWRWKRRLVRVLDSNVSHDEAISCAQIHSSLAAGDNSEHLESSLEGHKAFLEALIEEIEREPRFPITAAEKASGSALPSFRSFTYSS